MGWQVGSSSPAWTLGTSNYVPATAFTIVSAPASVQRGGSYSLVCTNVTEAPSAATLDGQPVTVDAWDSDGIDFTVPANTLAGHGNKTLSFTVDGATRTITLPHNPATGWLITPLASFSPGELNVFSGMTDFNTGDPVTPVAGGEILNTSPTTPNFTAATYPVLFENDGTLVIDVDGAIVDGSETFQVQYLLPGVSISNVATITVADYIGENTAPVAGAIPDQFAIAGAALALSVSPYITDPDDDVLTFAKTAGNSGVSMGSDGSVTGSIQGAASTYEITFTADDSYNDPVSASFNIITTLASPSFEFAPVTDANLSTATEFVSDVTGVPAGARLEFSGGEMSINGGASYTSASPVYAVIGQTRARATLTTSASNSTPVSGEMTINGVTREFTATTEAVASITLIAVRNTQLETVALTALPSYNATSITFQADTGSGFSTINTDSGAPFAYSYDASGVSVGDSIAFRAIDGDTISNEAVIRFRASTGRRGMARSITKSMTR